VGQLSIPAIFSSRFDGGCITTAQALNFSTLPANKVVMVVIGRSECIQ
jgi:hypothetical protein